MALGKWLGVVSRAVMAAANDRENSGEANAATGEENVGDWNVVQNNGQSQHRYKDSLPLETMRLDMWLTSRSQVHAQLKSSPMFIFT